jgi:molybdopterin-guanine dinucleotide biosynthesis protein A
MLRPPQLLLAGGLSRRMPGGKVFCRVGGGPMIAHIVKRLAAQTGRIAISANEDAARFAGLALPIVPDVVPGHLGPLAGIVSGMLFARERWPDATHVVSVPCDVPFLPDDLLERLNSARMASGNEIVVARSSGVPHPVIALWPVHMAQDLLEALRSGRARSVGAWISSSGAPVGFAEFAASAPAIRFSTSTRRKIWRRRMQD